MVFHIVILKVFYLLVLIVSYKVGIFFHVNKWIHDAVSWQDYIFSLAMLCP
nr:MAG TPA: hypothetical protein [Caudoviricetes sp.]